MGTPELQERDRHIHRMKLISELITQFEVGKLDEKVLLELKKIRQEMHIRILFLTEKNEQPPKDQ